MSPDPQVLEYYKRIAEALEALVRIEEKKKLKTREREGWQEQMDQESALGRA